MVIVLEKIVYSIHAEVIIIRGDHAFFESIFVMWAIFGR